MPYARFQKAAVDAAGNVLLNIWCEVRREDVAGNPLEPLFSDRLGAVPLSNPFMAADGVPAFHAAGGAYRVRYYKAGFDETYRYVGIGLGAESDVQGFVPMGAWDALTTYAINDVVTHPDGGDLYLFASRVDDNLAEEPDVTPQDSAFWAYIGVAVAGPAATITVGDVDTVPFGDPATVTNSGTSSAAVLDFEIPAGEPGDDGTTSYDWPFRFAGLPTANAVLDAFVAGREITFPADFAGSSGYIGTNPTSTLTLTIKSGGTWANDGTTVGTISISTSGVFTFATDGGTAKVISAGTLLKVIGPGSVDATAKDVAFTLLGDVP